MRYDIRITISHDYASPAFTGRHLVRMFPPTLHGRQLVERQRLAVSPLPVEQYDITDFFENHGTIVVHDMSHSRMNVTARMTIECINQMTPRLNIAPSLQNLQAELQSVTTMHADSPHHFLGRSPRIQPDPEIARYAFDQCKGNMTAREAVLTLGEALHRDMSFDPTTTSVDTPAGEAFALRSGVCQDFTHIMISGLRSLGIPAGYVSGYLRTLPPKGQPRLEGADAMHAWVRAWCGVEAGWMEYDPTNAVIPRQDHILVARGRDYSDISPLRGVLKTAGPQLSSQAVDVVPEGTLVA